MYKYKYVRRFQIKILNERFFYRVIIVRKFTSQNSKSHEKNCYRVILIHNSTVTVFGRKSDFCRCTRETKDFHSMRFFENI